jgi:glycosyltransferase involved in cell wall biosynthesis
MGDDRATTTPVATGTAISVVTTTYNRADLLPRVWASLQGESVPFEWIVVDDASTDDTEAVVAAFADPRIRYMRHPVNTGGPAAGRNGGAKAARARYVVFLDDDDELYPGALRRMVDILDRSAPEIGCVLFQCELPGGGRYGEPVSDGAVYDEADVVCRRVLGMEKICVYRREVFEEFQLPEDLLFGEAVFVFGLTRRYKFLMLDEPGRIYHHDSGVRFSNSDSIVRMSPLIARAHERILRNHRDVLAKDPEARLFYLKKALFRYSVGHARADSWRLVREILRYRRPGPAVFALTVFTLGVLRLAPYIERFRLPFLARRQVGRAGA